MDKMGTNKHKKLCYCRGLVSRNLATAKYLISKRLQLTNDLDICTPKVTAITAFR